MPMTSSRVNRSAPGGRSSPGARARRSRAGGPGVLDHRPGRVVGRQLGGAQPVVADHAPLVGVGDRAPLQRLHGVERGGHRRAHPFRQIGRQVHAADVQPEAQPGGVEEPLAVSVPQFPAAHARLRLARRKMATRITQSAARPPDPGRRPGRRWPRIGAAGEGNDRMPDYDVIVLGGGSAGTRAAAAAAKAGARTLAVNEGELGGLCILRGCMPTKAMLASAHALHAATHTDPSGIRLEGRDRVDGRARVDRIFELPWYHPTLSEVMLTIGRDAAARIEDLAGFDVAGLPPGHESRPGQPDRSD